MTTEELETLDNNQQFHEFIQQNINADVNKLRLKKWNDFSFDTKFAILQIECKNRIKKKLPSIFRIQDFYFPNLLSTEQCTAERIAQFHSTLLNENDSVLDMTAGLCIDAFHISQKVKEVTAFEMNKEIASISAFNMAKHTKNVTVINSDSVEYVTNCKKAYDAIFIDPARRGANNKRLFGMQDCTPDIVAILPIITNITNTLFIKASPMIDIQQSISDLNNMVSDVWAISINNECKELLFKVSLNNTYSDNYNIHTINFTNSGTQVFSINTCESTIPLNDYSIGNCKYLYEPNSSIMKAQLFAHVSNKFNLPYIQKNSHLYVSENFIDYFPGRCFSILEVIPFNNKEIKALAGKYKQINVSVRNFKLSAEELKKKLKVCDGGEFFLFGTTLFNGDAVMILCKKV